MKKTTAAIFVLLVLFFVGCAQTQVQPAVVAPTPGPAQPKPAPTTAPAQQTTTAPSVTNATPASSSSGVSTCTDTDGGKNYAVQGTITGTDYLGRPYNYTDRCTGDTVLQEYYCDNTGTGVFIYYKCPNGCANGACK